MYEAEVKRKNTEGGQGQAEHTRPPWAVQRKASASATFRWTDLSKGADKAVVQRKAYTEGLPSSLKSEGEKKSGLPMDDVRVHYNSDEPAQLKALAFTQGNNIYMGPGQEQHLSHEMGHVIQQKRGEVSAQSSVNGVPLNNSTTLERAADNWRQSSAAPVQRKVDADGAGVVQRKVFIGKEIDYTDNLFQTQIGPEDPLLDLAYSWIYAENMFSFETAERFMHALSEQYRVELEEPEVIPQVGNYNPNVTAPFMQTPVKTKTSVFTQKAKYPNLAYRKDEDWLYHATQLQHLS